MAFGSVIRNYFHVLRADGFVFRGRRKFGLVLINKTGLAIATDKLVAISGYDTTSGLPKMVLADADAANLATEVFVTTKSVADGKTATVYKGGLSAANLNTNSVTSVGDPVYLDTTAGGFTATAPATAVSRVVIVGYVKTKSATVGQIVWDVQDPQKIGSNDITGGAVPSTLTTYSGDGAITIASQVALLTKGSAAAMTVAVPGASGVGVRITITSGSNFAHVITFTGGTLGDGTTGLNTTVTMTAFIGSSITVIGNTATQWVVESQNQLTSIV